MQTPFSTKTHRTPSWFGRVFKTGSRADGEQALVNLLASNPIEKITASDLSAVFQRQGIGAKEGRGLLRGLYLRALTAFLADANLSVEETAYLRRLADALNLSATETLELQTTAIRERYEALFAEVVADNQVTEAERQQLARAAEHFQLTPSEVNQIQGASSQRLIQKRFDAMVADRRLSPAEDAELQALAEALGAKLTISTPEAVEKFRLLWRIDNGQLPTESVPITLQKGETCHFHTSCTWLEMRRRTVRTTYSGFSTSIRIAKGIRYRVGTITPQRVTRDELTPIDTGVVYFTSKRVIFDGSKANKVVTLRSLLGVDVFADGIQLEKASGKPPFLEMYEDVPLAAAILSAALAKAA